jgi:Flp pilus assembly protein TadG
MKDSLRFKKARAAQTFIFFFLAFGLICLLCGLAIDSGLLYLAKARLSRAVDGAALVAVGNAADSRDTVASLMRNFAIANYSDLQTVSSSATAVQTFYTTTTGLQAAEYTYTFVDNTSSGGADPKGNPPYRRYVQVILQTGSGGQITSAQCNARCPVGTYFMGALFGTLTAGNYTGVNAFRDLKVSSSAVATRNPRLIMVVVDRSGSMLFANGGAFGLPAAITTFLNFFDTSSDYIGIVSFSSAARLEMPLTTNFLYAGTNDLYDSYQIDTNSGLAIPGVDPEEYTNSGYVNGTGYPSPRRLKFGGQTAADEGMRMAMEQLMQNPGFTNPNVVKYIVLFTDGAWNTARTLLAAPGYTNVFNYPNNPSGSLLITPAYAQYVSQYLSSANLPAPLTAGYLPMPSLSPWVDTTTASHTGGYSNAVTYSGSSFDYQDHLKDIWQSADTTIYEPLGSAGTIIGTPTNVANYNGYLLTYPTPNPPGSPPLYNYSPEDIYTTFLNVWLPPGAVDYVYQSGNTTPIAAYVSDYTNPTKTVNVQLNPNQSNVLVVPGYVVDGIFSDTLDLPFPDDPTTYPKYRANNFNEPFMWPDDQNPDASSAGGLSTYEGGNDLTQSVERNLMFRNYANLLTGYYIFRPDDPIGPASNINPFTGAVNPLNANGPYYPSAAFYWPFDLVGLDEWGTESLTNPISDPDPTDSGYSRHIAYSINMLTNTAAPEYSGELFYEATGGTGVLSTTTNSVSTQITTASQWQDNMPNWAKNPYVSANIMTNETSHFPLTNGGGIGGEVWRPITFNGQGSLNGLVTSTNQISLSDGNNYTGGYVQAGPGGPIYRNAMAYSGRPTHYFDFSTSQWLAIPDNHHTNVVAFPLGSWKAQEYAWHARDKGITIFTVGYGNAVNNDECAVLAQVANSTNVITPGGTAGTTVTNSRSYISQQPIGQQFYANTTNDISNDFYQVGTAISGALTQ